MNEWPNIRDALLAANPPDWVREILATSDSPASEALSVKEYPLDGSYIHFLRDQIAVDARGPAWTQLLQKRLDALAPVVPTQLVTVLVRSASRSFMAYFDLKSARVVHWEAESE